MTFDRIHFRKLIQYPIIGYYVIKLGVFRFAVVPPMYSERATFGGGGGGNDNASLLISWLMTLSTWRKLQLVLVKSFADSILISFMV